MRDTTNSSAYQRWKLLVVERAERYSRGETTEEKAFLPHVRTLRMRREERKREGGREREKRKKKRKGSNGKTS